MTAARKKRRELGADAIIAPSHAAELLPFRQRDALAWLRDEGLVHRVFTPAGPKEVVVWGDVVERVKTPLEEAPKSKPRSPRGTVTDLPRVALGRKGRGR